MSNFLNEKSEGGNVHYLTISNGSIIKQVDADTPGAHSRINKVGKTVWEKEFSSVVGKITAIQLHENKFSEREFRVTIKAGDNTAVLTIKYDSSYGRSFIPQLLNVDLSKNIIFTPWQKRSDDGKVISRLYLSYGKGEPVSREYPAGTPKVEWLEMKGKPVMDTKSKIAFDEFIDAKLEDFIKSNNLEYHNPKALDFEGLDPEFVEEMSKPLSKEEQAQLKGLKKSTRAKSKANPMDEIVVSADKLLDDDSLDDFFN